jgi:hypothetical protein
MECAYRYRAVRGTGRPDRAAPGQIPRSRRHLTNDQHGIHLLDSTSAVHSPPPKLGGPTRAAYGRMARIRRTKLSRLIGNVEEEQ